MYHGDFPFVTTTHHFLVNTWGGNIGIIAQVDVYEGDVGDPDAPLRKYTASLPPRSEIEDLVYSPSGDRIAWLLTTGEYTPGEARKEARTGIWVSNIDSGEMHEVGSVTGPQDEAWYVLPHTIHWLPNGKALSFLYKSTLWTVPVK